MITRFRPLISLAILSIIGFFIYTQWHIVWGSVWANYGFVSLNHSLTSVQYDRGLIVAEDSLHRSLAVSQGALQSNWQGLAIAHLERGELEAAVEAWKQSGLPVHMLIDQRIGIAEVNEAKNVNEALRLYDQAIQIGLLTNQARSKPYLRSGLLYQRRLNEPNLVRAEFLYREALRINTFQVPADHSACYYQLAEVMRWQQFEPNQYIDYYKNAVDINPKNYMARVWLGTTIYRDSQNIEAAEYEIRRVLEDLPNHYWAHVHLGDLYREEGLLSEAKELYETALSINGTLDAAHQRLDWIKGLESP